MQKLLLVLCLLFAFPVSASTIPEGAIVKTANNPDVYIVKYLNGGKYKRLVLNPLVFKSYGHLKWENLLTISDSEMNSFISSNLVKVDGSSDVYELAPTGDNGTKQKLSSTWGLDLSSVYIINAVDFGNYLDNGIKHRTSYEEAKALEDAQKAKDEKAAADKEIADTKAKEEAAYKLTKEYREQNMKPVIEKIDNIIAGYDKQISELSTKIDDDHYKLSQANKNKICSGAMTDAGCAPIWNAYVNPIQKDLSELQPKLSQFLINKDCLLSIKIYRIQDYIDYGVIIPAADRTYLPSLGIDFRC